MKKQIAWAVLLSVSMTISYAAPGIDSYTAVPADTSTTIYTGAQPSTPLAVVTQAVLNAGSASNDNSTTTSQAQFQLTINNNTSGLYVLVVPTTDNTGVTPCRLLSGETGIHYVNSSVASCAPSPGFSEGAPTYYLYISTSSFSNTDVGSANFNYTGLPFNSCSINSSNVVTRIGKNAPYKLTSGTVPYVLTVNTGSCSIGQSSG